MALFLSLHQAPGLSPEEIAHFALQFVSDEGAPVSGAVVDLEQYPMIGRNPRKTVG